MLILVAVLLALIPAIAILYPFIFQTSAVLDDEASTRAELEIRWDAALSGLRNTELEHAIGNLTDKDYWELKEQYMTDAAVVMKAMELASQQEQELLADIEKEVKLVREKFSGERDA